MPFEAQNTFIRTIANVCTFIFCRNNNLSNHNETVKAGYEAHQWATCLESSQPFNPEYQGITKLKPIKQTKTLF